MGERRFRGLRDLVTHLQAQADRAASRGLAAIGGRSRAARLQDDEPLVTLQVGRSVFEAAPRQMRIELWMSSLQRKGIGVAAAARYEDMLLARVGEEAAADIDKDLGRTFPSTKRFASAEGQEALRRVLTAYAAYDPEVGYCQGMNFVAGLLLMYLPERHAFGGLVVMMHDRGLRRYFSTDMSLLQTHLWQLGRLMPARLCAHLESIGVLPLLYGASWLMTCFSADFPASFSARVMDVIMSDKMQEALLKAAVGLLKAVEGRLLGMSDMEDALHLLKLELPAWEPEKLHSVLTDAFAHPWSSRQLALLGSVEGAESVAEALERVQRANLSSELDGRGEAEAGGRPSTPHSRAATPGAGSSSPGQAAAPLFPPPPSPKRTSSAGGGMLSRPASRAHSQVGASPTASGGGVDHNSSRGGAAPASQQLQQQQPLPPPPLQQWDLIDLSSPRAGAPAAGSGFHGPQQQQQQQQQPAPSGWDPFGDAAPSGSNGLAHSHSHQEQPQPADLLHEQLQQLSFSQLPHQPQPHAHSHLRPQQEQQQEQHQQPAAERAPTANSADDWSDFVCSPGAAQPPPSHP